MFENSDCRQDILAQLSSGELDAVLWTDKKRPFFGKPISFTRYTLYTDRLTIDSGLLTLRQEELRLYRVLDVTLRQTLGQRIFGIGTVILTAGDATTPKLLIQDVKDPRHVMKLLSTTTELERQRYRIGMVEGIGPIF